MYGVRHLKLRDVGCAGTQAPRLQRQEEVQASLQAVLQGHHKFTPSALSLLQVRISDRPSSGFKPGLQGPPQGRPPRAVFAAGRLPFVFRNWEKLGTMRIWVCFPRVPTNSPPARCLCCRRVCAFQKVSEGLSKFRILMGFTLQVEPQVHPQRALPAAGKSAVPRRFRKDY